MAGVTDIAARYLNAVASHDWAAVDACIADDIVRVGPYGDRFEGS
jgi:ketosteroid isomerase-like protein